MEPILLPFPICTSAYSNGSLSTIFQALFTSYVHVHVAVLFTFPYTNGVNIYVHDELVVVIGC